MSALAARLPASHGPTRVRTFVSADIDAFHAYRSDAELARFQSWSPMSHDEARIFVGEMLGVTQLVPGGWIQLAIADAATDALLGDLGLFLSDDLAWGEIGFTLCAAAQGHGHATRAVGVACELLFDANPAIEIRAVTDARNTPSVRVLQRSGFTQVAAQETVFKGEPCTELVFGLRRTGTT